VVVVVFDQCTSAFTIPRLIGMDRLVVVVTVVGWNWGPKPRPLSLGSQLVEKESMMAFELSNIDVEWLHVAALAPKKSLRRRK
jgi:hypothetical protein